MRRFKIKPIGAFLPQMHKRSALSRSDSTERDLCAPATTTTNPLSRLGNLTLGVGAASRPVSRCSSAQPPISEQVPADITKAGEGNRLKSGAALAAANRSRSSLELRRAASRRRSILMVEPAIQHLSPSRWINSVIGLSKRLITDSLFCQEGIL